jgi:hypothetical protein
MRRDAEERGVRREEEERSKERGRGGGGWEKR